MIAYLIREKKMKYNDALNYVREKRSFVQPNCGFELELQDYEKLYL